MVTCTHIFLKLLLIRDPHAGKYNIKILNKIQVYSFLITNSPQLELILNTCMYIEESLMVMHWQFYLKIFQDLVFFLQTMVLPVKQLLIKGIQCCIL